MVNNTIYKHNFQKLKIICYRAFEECLALGEGHLSVRCYYREDVWALVLLVAV